MKRLPPLNDASPPEHWEAKAKELGLSVESLREQVRLADEAMEEILREESSSHAWRIPDFGDQIRSGFEARDFKAWFIFTAMSHLPPYEDIVKKFFSADGSIPGAVEIELRVNGQLVNAEAAFKELESSFNSLLLDAAASLLEDKLGAVDTLIEDVRRNVKNAMRASLPDAYFHDDDRD